MFAQYTASLKPNEKKLKLYNEILDDLRKEKNINTKQDINDLEKELQKIDSNISKVDDKFIQDDIDKPTHNRLIERYNNDKAHLQGRIYLMKTPNHSVLEPKLKYSINQIDNYFRNAKIEVKIKLLGSMFPERIIFDGKSHRTNSYNSVLDLIYQQTNELRGIKKESRGNFNNFSACVPRAGIEPAWK